MKKGELERLENKSWIIQVFDPTAQVNPHWSGIHYSKTGDQLFQVDNHDADQYELEVCIKHATLFAKSITSDAWKKFDWCVYNFRTLERIVVSAL